MPFRFLRSVWCLILIPGILYSATIQASELPYSIGFSKQKLFIFSLFEEKDYYRAISEIYRIKFDNSQKFDSDLELILLQSRYQLQDYDEAIGHSRVLLETHQGDLDSSQLVKIGATLSASLLEKGEVNEASGIWNQYCSKINGVSFPENTEFPEPVDPNQAKLLSTILPGAGLVYTGDYGKAAISFLLNAVFIAGIYHYGSNNQYGIAGLLTFFEIGWYTGGRNAAYESAENYNKRYILGAQQAWIDKRLNLP